MSAFDVGPSAQGYNMTDGFGSRDAFTDQAPFGMSGSGGGAFGSASAWPDLSNPQLGGISGGGDDALGPITQEEARQLTKAFKVARNSDGFVSADEGKRQLQETGLPDQMLRNIWDLSDLDRDSRLSFREFLSALHIANQVRKGRQMPVEVRPEAQEALARSAERLCGGLDLTQDGDDAKHPRPEDFSTMDTMGSDTHRGHRHGSRSRRHRHDRSDADHGLHGFGGTLYDTRDSTGVSSGFESGGGHRDEDHLTSPDQRGLGFDTSGALGSRTRGRDPLPGPRGHGHRDADRLWRTSDERGIRRDGAVDAMHGATNGDSAGLGQLASIFEVMARLDAGGELRRLGHEVLDERKELERQLSRRRDFERQLQELRRRLDSMREDRRKVERETAANQRHITHLQDELGFVRREVRDAEEDLTLLRESSNFAREGKRGPAPYSSAAEERRDVLSKVRAERELLQRDQRAIEDLRSRLDEVLKQKIDSQAWQQSLLEKQRQNEQDRGLMLTAIEAERGKLSSLRADRINMWEERSKLEREMMLVAQERWLNDHGGGEGELGRGPGVPSECGHASVSDGNRSKGIRQDDRLPPAVVFGNAHHDKDQGRFVSATDRVEGGVRVGEARDRDFAVGSVGNVRSGNRGVRKEAHGYLSGAFAGELGDSTWQSFRGRAEHPAANSVLSDRSDLSRHTATFGG